jgi:pseudouridine-5'-monophosphatase
LIKTGHLIHLVSYFGGNIVCSDDPGVLEVGRGKPCPDMFLAAAQMLGMDVGKEEQCTTEQQDVRSKGLVFEDAVAGAIAGKRAGMKGASSTGSFEWNAD